MTVPEQFRARFLDIMSKEDLTVKEAAEKVIKKSPALFSFDLAAKVIGISESKLRKL